MRFRAVLVIAVLGLWCAGFALGQKPASVGTVKGAVLGIANSPLQGATIQLGNATAVSAADGSFTLADVPVGKGVLVVTLDGYKPARQMVEVREGQTTSVTVQLEAEQPKGTEQPPDAGAQKGSIAVTVVAGGSPVQGAKVSADAASATTDASGKVVLSDLPAGEIAVRVAADGYAAAVKEVDVVAGQTADVTVELSAAPAGGEGEHQPAPGAVQAVVVSAATGQPVQGAPVTLGTTTATTDADGKALFSNLTPGRYIVSATSGDTASGNVAVTVRPGQTTVVRLELAAQPSPTGTGSISGKVLADGNPVAGAMVRVGHQTAISDADGAFTLSGLRAGIVVLSVTAEGYARYSTTVTVDPDATANVTVTLTPCRADQGTGSLLGTVVSVPSHSPVAGASVVVGSLTATTGADGKVALNDVPAGAQVVVITAAGFRRFSAVVYIVPGKATERTFEMQPQSATGVGSINGTVVAADTGQPIVGATVDIGTATAQTADDGTFSFTNLAPGEYLLTITKGGFRTARREVQLRPGQDVSRNVALEPVEPAPAPQGTGTITGTVKVGDQPAGAAAVRARGIVATTAADGTFTLPNVPAGAVSVTAALSGYLAATVQVDLTAGGTATADIALTPVPAPDGTHALIQGAVTTEVSGGTQAVVGAVVRSRDQITLTDANGQYSLMVSLKPNQSACNVSVFADGYVSQSKRVSVTPGSTVNDVNFALVADDATSSDVDEGEDGADAGDVNGDETISTADVVTVLKAAIQAVQADPTLLARADVSPKHKDGAVGDGVVDLGDVIRLLRALIGLEEVWP